MLSTGGVDILTNHAIHWTVSYPPFKQPGPDPCFHLIEPMEINDVWERRQHIVQFSFLFLLLLSLSLSLLLMVN